MRLGTVPVVSAVLGIVPLACGELPPAPPPPEVPSPTPEVSSLAVLASAPADGATGVARAATVTVFFSEPVEAGSVNAETFALWQGAEQVNGAISLNDAGTIATLVPRELLTLGTNYAVTVSRGVRDTAGQPLPREYRAAFLTKVNRVP
jgi:hypothetical protein